MQNRLSARQDDDLWGSPRRSEEIPAIVRHGYGV